LLCQLLKFGKVFAVFLANVYAMKKNPLFSKISALSLVALFLLTSASNGQAPIRKAPNNAFQAGEVVEYRIHYGSVTAGTAKLEIKPETVDVNGRKCYHMVGQGISSKSFGLFFRVNDRYETFVDVESLAPQKFKRKIEEGSFKHYAEVEFDQVNHKAYERRSTVQHVTTYDVPPYIQDVMSAFYFARTQDYSAAKPGSTYKFQNFIDHKVHDLDVTFVAREVIEVGGIKYKTVKLKPLVKEGGIFTHEGDMYLWISDDENRIPVRVESGLVIGSVQVDLEKCSNLRHPMTSRVR
jgi:hypothetical protein